MCVWQVEQQLVRGHTLQEGAGVAAMTFDLPEGTVSLAVDAR